MSISRQCFSGWRLAAVAVAALALSGGDGLAQGQRPRQTFNIVPIEITSVVLQNGQLVANGVVGGQPFSSPITLTPRQSGQACPILDLQLGPIDLNLLGLRVQTSPICLQVTAFEGGGLLGDLLCSVANLLQGGTPIGTILDGLSASDRTALLNGLANLFNEVLDLVTSNNLLNQPTGSIQASCTVLELALGPLELDLLGLVVELDDCANGPVTVTITAIPGGGLLGDLLCSLTDLLNNGGAAPRAIQQLLWNITALLNNLLR